MTRRVERGERGSVTVMTIGFLVVIGLLLAVVVNASSAYLQRQELAHLTDGAALAAADGLDEGAFYADRTIELDPAASRQLVAGYLAGEDVAGVDVAVRGDTVSVRLERDVELPFTPPGWPDQARVSAEASSQLPRP
ncbi:hypothetical protein GCM10008944_24640 [Cytobacillus oceanisediminis]